MITTVEIENFKKFESAKFNISHPVSLFVGPNNGGKTTALQAISLWSFLILQWELKRGNSSARKRVATPVTRNTIHPVPTLEIADLWTEGQVRVKGKTSENIRIRIKIKGRDDETALPWEYGVEATFANKELLYAKPIDIDLPIPSEIGKIFHLPPLSGVQTEEPKIDPGAQLRAIGEGRPGEVLRNLLLNLHEKFPDKWIQLVAAVKDFFAIDILPIRYNPVTDPRISVYYQSVAGAARASYKMEISSGGSGFLQFLLIAAFLLVHDNAVLLIDEPDSHMHVFLQRAVFDWLQKTAIQEKAQIIISTHSEVLINSCGIENLVTFFGANPKELKAKSSDLISALSDVSPLAIINAEWKGKVIYIEGDSDRKLLMAWAEALNHPVRIPLSQTYFHAIGTNSASKANKHFSVLRSVITNKKVSGFLLRDNDATTPNANGLAQGLKCVNWALPEIENYLLHPEALIEFIGGQGYGPLFASTGKTNAEKYLSKHLTPAYYSDPHNNPRDMGKKKGSDFLEEFFTDIGVPLNKPDYWRIAHSMTADQVFPDVKTMLDDLQSFLEE